MSENSGESQFINNVKLYEDGIPKQLYDNLIAYNSDDFNIDDEPEFIKGVRHRKDIISKELYDHMIFCGSNEFNKLPKEAKELIKEHSKPMCAYFASLTNIIEKFDGIKHNKVINKNNK